MLDGFESDAFAPLWQGQEEKIDAGPSNPWGVFREEKVNPWAGFGGKASVFGRQAGVNAQVQVSVEERQISDASEDEDMDMEMEDEDDVEDAMFGEEQAIETVQRVMGYPKPGNDGPLREGVGGTWGAGTDQVPGQCWSADERGRRRS
jgi:hypothetical protein